MPQTTSPQLPRETASAPQLEFSSIGRTGVRAVFDEPDLSSDGGALLLREAAEANGIIDAMAAVLRDDRSQAHVKHTQRDQMMQRTVLICPGVRGRQRLRHHARRQCPEGRERTTSGRRGAGLATDDVSA
jgi:hypothetical protein